MANRRVDNVVLENCRIMYRNFAGQGDKYNPAGRRNFCAILDRKTADRMVEEGWNVKQTKPRDEYDEPVPYVQVRVNFSNIPPEIYLVNSRNKKTRLTEETVSTLDYAEIENVDLIISGYCWEMNGNEGVTAYCKTMYVKIVEDVFADKYSDED